MTNLEHLIAALTDEIDDGGAAYEAAVHYNIACPHYFCVKNLPCEGRKQIREICVQCKMEWLDKEVEE